MSVKISELTAVSTPLAGTEILVGVQESTTKRLTLDQIVTFATSELLDSATGTPTAGDEILIERADACKRLDIDALASYVIASGWSVAVAPTPDTTTTGDKFLGMRGATVYEFDVLKTYVLSDALTFSSLTLATLGDSDKYLVVQGTTPKYTTWTAIAARAHSQFAAYLATLDAVAENSVADADKFYLTQSGTGKYVTAAVLADYVADEIGNTSGTALWAADAVSPDLALVADEFVIQRSAVQKTVTSVGIAAYTVSTLAAADAVASVVDAYKFVMFDGTTAKTATADVLATYMATELFADSAATTPALGSHKVLAWSSSLISLTVDVLKSYILTDVQATALDIDALSAATLADANYLYVMDGTAKQNTLGNIGSYINGKWAAYVGDQADGAPVVDSDLFAISRSDATKQIAADDLASYVQTYVWTQTAGTTVVDADQFLMYRSGTGYRLVTGQMFSTYIATDIVSTIFNLSTLTPGTVAESNLLLISQSGSPKSCTVAQLLALRAPNKWTVLTADTDYTAAPTNTYTIAAPSTANYAVGLAVRYKFGGNTYYGVITEVNTNTSILIRGPDISGTLTELAVGVPSQTVHMHLRVPGAYLIPWATHDSDLMANLFSEVLYEEHRWTGAPAKLVAMSVVQGEADSTINPYINVLVDAAAVFQDATSTGVQPGALGTPVWNSYGNVNSATYSAGFNAKLELYATVASAPSGEAQDLCVDLVFVLE